MIYTDIHELANNIVLARSYSDNDVRHCRGVIATSGGFDPLHIGHIRIIRQSQSLDDEAVKWYPQDQLLIVIVNGDGFLTRKKGKPFMKLEERMEIINAIKGVDAVVPWDDGSQTVIGALAILKPNIFTKGGDRSSSDVVPEAEICQQIGCKIIYGVGGTDKVQSSSDLIKGIS